MYVLLPRCLMSEVLEHNFHDNQFDELKRLISRHYHIGRPSVDPALIDHSLCLMSQQQ